MGALAGEDMDRRLRGSVSAFDERGENEETYFDDDIPELRADGSVTTRHASSEENAPFACP